MSEPLAILRAGVFCPVGLDVEQAGASILAGIPRKQETLFRSKYREPIVMGCLPTDVLPPLVAELEDPKVKPMPLVVRLLRLATVALQEVLGTVGAGIRALPRGLTAMPPLFVVGPQARPGEPAIVSGTFVGQLVRQARAPVALEASRVFPSGHAGLFTALQEAHAKVLAPGVAEFVVVGGVDSYFDAERLAGLERENRLLTRGVQDAFTPGEGAAFLLIASRSACVRHRLEPIAWIPAVATALEPGHRYSDEPHRGDGLATALRSVFGAVGEHAQQVRLVMAGLNGESFPAKEWGIACVRNRERFADPLRIEHPAEYTGDAGAALAPIMLAVTAMELKAKNLEGPAVVWASSDQAERGALFVEHA